MCGVVFWFLCVDRPKFRVPFSVPLLLLQSSAVLDRKVVGNGPNPSSRSTSSKQHAKTRTHYVVRERVRTQALWTGLSLLAVKGPVGLTFSLAAMPCLVLGYGRRRSFFFVRQSGFPTESGVQKARYTFALAKEANVWCSPFVVFEV